MWKVYILECRDGSYYTGITNNLALRLRFHQDGKASKYTRSRRPVALKYTEEFKNKSIALKREIAIKKLTREEKKRLLRIGLGKHI